MMTAHHLTSVQTRTISSTLWQGRALITGASQGLGRALSHECARLGMDLILVALPGSGLPQVAAEVEQQYGVQALYREADLTEPGSIEALWQWIAEQRLPVSALINNAGVGYNCRFEDSTLHENETCILLNNLALVKLTRLLLPELKRHEPAFVLNVASMAAFFPMPFMPVYAPSKAFILNFSLALRQEMRHTSVRVSVLCPNGMRTNAAARYKIERSGMMARLTCMDPEPVAAYTIRQLLAGRTVIVPGRLNQAIVTLSRYVPSQVIYAVISTFWGRTAQLGVPAQVAENAAQL